MHVCTNETKRFPGWSEATLLRVALVLASFVTEGDATRASGSISVYEEITRREPHAPDSGLRLDIWRQQVVSNDTGLSEDLIRQLLRWVYVLLEGRVELHHELAVPLGLIV